MPARAAQFARNLQRFRLITFDITDTLLQMRPDPAAQYAKTALDLGVTHIDQQRLKLCFRQQFKAMAREHPNFGRHSADMTWQQWWIQLVERIFRCENANIPAEQLRHIAETLLQLYRTSACWKTTEGSEECLQRIRDAGKQLGVISNFDPSLPSVLRAMHIERYFDFVLTSHDAGVEKPDKKIFGLARKYCGVAATHALHIGNICDIDYVGARQAGWCSLLVLNEPQQRFTAQPQHCFANLKDMLFALETCDIEW